MRYESLDEQVGRAEAIVRGALDALLRDFEDDASCEFCKSHNAERRARLAHRLREAQEQLDRISALLALKRNYDLRY